MAVENSTSPSLRIASDITQLVGHTPMLKLARVVPTLFAAVFAKLEFLNPGGSIKDRAALGMILDAEAKGLLHPGSTIVEATAGNTGVGLALIGVNRGYAVKLFVPEGFAEEKCILMRGFGAEVVRTPEAEGMAGAIRLANERLQPRLRMHLWPGSSRTSPIRNFTTRRRPLRFGSRWRAVWMGLWPVSGRAGHFQAWRGS